MRVVTVERTINAPIADVYAWLADSENLRRVPGCLSLAVRPGPDGPGAVGTVRTVTTALLKVTEQITSLDPPKQIEYCIQSSLPPTRHTNGTIEFRETSAGTRVVWTSRFEVAVPVLGSVLEPITAKVMALGFRLTMGAANKELVARR